MPRSSARLIAAAALVVAPFAAADMPSRTLHQAPALAPVFVAPGVAAQQVASLPPLVAPKRAADGVDAVGRMRVGEVRAIEKSATPPLQWTPVRGGYVARLQARSADAHGLRLRLDLGAVPGAMEARAQGADGRIEAMVLDPLAGPEAWTPWTAGDAQVVELFSAVRPAPDAVRVGGVLHMDQAPYAKAAQSCTIPTVCSTGNPALDEAIAERKKSVMRLSFVEDGGGFVCSGTVINTDLFPAAYVVTANHCISTPQSAASVTTLWFYESADCSAASGPKAGQVQVAGGTQLVFTNYNVDSTLLLMNQSTPAGAVYSGWNTARLATGSGIVSISHPAGDTSRLAQGSVTQEYRIINVPQDMYGVRFTQGIIEGGSSGSGLFTLANGSLQLRGILTGSTVRNPGGLSCTNLNEEGLYSRFEIFQPQIAPFIGASRPADDAPNRVADVPAAPVAESLDALPQGLQIENRRIDYVGDVDVYKFTLANTSYVSVSTYGPNIDTVGSILDSAGRNMEAEDDAQRGDNHFGVTRRLAPGTYYVQVAHWEPDGTGPYNLRLHAATVDRNYTDLWWNPAESGWGVNFNHQGHILFGTLFTYGDDGRPMWLVMSNGARQPDGSYQGELYRATGPAFNAVPFTGVALQPVGNMRVSFATADSGTLTYSVDGRQVTKQITRQAFSTQPTCTWSGFDRSYAGNYQDLWWNPAESGWGVNIAHQGDILFATLFTYGPDRQGTWYVMSEGRRNITGAYTGTLYRASGPAFDANPWRPVALAAVGTMTFSFNGGNAATLTYSVDGTSVTKQVERQVFSNPKTSCES